MTTSNTNPNNSTRRTFLGTTASLSAGAVALPKFARVSRKPQTIKVGLVGCGGRGTGAAHNCVESSEGVEIHALGDLMPERLQRCRDNLSTSIGNAFQVKDETCFTGFDAYKQVLASDIDLVILATPPGFRPMMFEAAVEAGKHVFMEKPVAVCPAGVRQVIAAGEKAKTKGLAVVSGTQRRHEPGYLATIEKLSEGAIGDIVSARCYWNQGFLWSVERKPEFTDLEWQIRNWLYFTWLSGDHIVEQHIHNIDVINWVMGGPPKIARGMGGRQVRTDERFGHIFDHFSIEYEYPNGVKLQSLCRQIDGTWRRVGEEVHGTKGHCNPSGRIRGEKNWKFEKPEGKQNPYVLEHRDLIASIRQGEPLNEARRVAESTLTAIIGRMSAYSGKEVEFAWAMEKSELDLRREHLDFGMQLEVPPVAMPGSTPLV
ncbi:MAG: Gfo/Idh/MocA family oxidoreductase [Planctomycetes bacterium]|nr:Gfo/Idh/MocA family oxidoreductase [Planctomycetota bacterium]